MYRYKHKTSGEVIETANKVTSKNWILVEEKGTKAGDTKKGDTKKGDAKKGDAKKGDAKKGDAKKEVEGQ